MLHFAFPCNKPLILLQTRMLVNINSQHPSDGKMELLVARLAVNNSIIDPWIYIVLRKENFEFVEKMYKKCTGTATSSEPQSSTSIHNSGKQPSTGSSNDCTVFNIQI